MSSLLRSLSNFARPFLNSSRFSVISSCQTSMFSSSKQTSTSKSITSSNPLPIEKIANKFRQHNISNHAPVTEDVLQSVVANRAYHELPILHLKADKNNTKVHLTDCNGRSLVLTSCGIEGYKNARKQTTVSCQATGIALGLRAKKLGVSAVRVVIKGTGRGRLPALQGFVTGGLSIVSITDNTPIHYGLGRRPRKVPKK